jgi:hypothetical protein
MLHLVHVPQPPSASPTVSPSASQSASPSASPSTSPSASPSAAPSSQTQVLLARACGDAAASAPHRHHQRHFLEMPWPAAPTETTPKEPRSQQRSLHADGPSALVALRRGSSRSRWLTAPLRLQCLWPLWIGPLALAVPVATLDWSLE